MNTHASCLLCESSELKNLEGYQSSHLCKCGNCGFIFSKAIPSSEELESHYEGYGRNDYLSPITIKRYNELLDEFEPFRKTGRIIDVGCGIGYFLTEAKKRGWEVYGTEFTDEAVSICSEKGINIEKGALSVDNYPPESFDIVTSFEVLEHINNPSEEIEQFQKLLRKDGLVYLTTPNFNSLLRYKLKNEYNIICYPEHLSYYTPKTLRKLFRNKGFKTKKVKTTGYSRTRLKTSQKKSDQSFISASSDDEIIRNKIEGNPILQLAKRSVNGLLTVFGVGDTVKGYFVKK